MEIVNIAGIDVGTTSAIVVIDESGKIVGKLSGKNLSEEEIIKFLSEYSVVLIATDKARVPERIKKIAARLNIGVFSPKKDLPVEYKKKFWNYDIDNEHELDALASAIYALTQVKDIIEKALKNMSKEEAVKVLKKVFKDMKDEPITLYKFSKEEEKRNEKKKIRRKRKIIKPIDIEITIVKREEKVDNKELEELKKKYLDLLIKFDELSIAVLEGRELIPKYSFLKKVGKSYKKVFIDVSENIVGSFKEIYIPEGLNVNVFGKKFIVKRYKDLGNFVIIEEVVPINEEEDINKAKEIIKKYLRHTSFSV